VALAAVLLAGLLAQGKSVRAQASDGMLSEREVESLRDSAFVPLDRIAAYEKILNDRERMIDDLMKKPHHVTFGPDMHDLIEQFGAIADELNDNLDEYNSRHRDVRKLLPKLVLATERWSTSLRAPGDDDAYKVVRKIALDALKDMKATAEEMEASQEAYFKAHPEAAKQEKERRDSPHAPDTGEPPK
jgi:hypothetical protein